MNNKLNKFGYFKTKILSKRQINHIKQQIFFYYDINKKSDIIYKIVNMYKKKPSIAGNRYDLLNLDLKIQSIFFSNRVANKIKRLFSQSKKLSEIKIGFADFQILVMLPKSKKENLGWHQDSAYFKYSRKNFSNLVVWTPISLTSDIVNGSLDIVRESHKKGIIFHNENLHKNRKKVSIEKRGRFYIDKKKISQKKIVNLKVKSGESLIFDANSIHRTSAKSDNANDIRFTIISRYKYLNKLKLQ
tara:strand:+ start:227 stop:961 length:735 start_codon:yes stop_codon:yes gene_type:complete